MQLVFKVNNQRRKADVRQPRFSGGLVFRKNRNCGSSEAYRIDITIFFDQEAHRIAMDACDLSSAIRNLFSTYAILTTIFRDGLFRPYFKRFPLLVRRPTHFLFRDHAGIRWV